MISIIKRLKTFYIVFFISVIIFLIVCASSGGGFFSDILFSGSNGDSDYFMDFFNSIRYASSGDVYERKVIYPPLANAIFYLLSLFISPDLAFSSQEDRLLLRNDFNCLFIYFIFAGFCLVLFYKIISKFLKEKELGIHSSLIPFALLFSYPMLYCFQRGNMTILAMVLSMIFVFFRNSENKYIKELSYISLALAAGLKIYPALFGLLLITDRKYKEALRLVVYGIIAFFLPFFFYDGFESMALMFKNLVSFSDTSSNIVTFGFINIDFFALYINLFLGIDYSIIYNVLFISTYLSAILVFFLSKEEWQKVWAVSFMIMNQTSTARTYILIFAIIPFVIFIIKHKYNFFDKLYFIMFLLFFIVITPIYYNYIDEIFLFFKDRFGKTIDPSSDVFFICLNQLLAPFMLVGSIFLMLFENFVVRLKCFARNM